mmetsp:Transcript_15333/g.39466  ORF Transcript_15333/g.39466 Transcript_15333/m.39466 type:complete len:179 (-) Transcript_15333:1746-2282(-)
MEAFRLLARQVIRRLWVIPVGVTVWDLGVCIRPVEGRSMQPVLNPEAAPGAVPSRNWVLVNRWAALSVSLMRGDVVILTHPEKKDVSVVKRIVAFEGDVIKTNGYKKQQYLKIPVGHCWVEGDHPVASKDSNSYGPVPLGLLTGKVIAILWPVPEIARVATDLSADAKARSIHVNPKW